MGVSVEREKYLTRIDHLRRTGAKTKFLSLEPLIGPLPNMNLEGIHWAIVGGESGPGCRPMSEMWVLDIRDQCKKAKVPFFFKQWGGVNKKKWDVSSKAKPGTKCQSVLHISRNYSRELRRVQRSADG